MFWSSSKKENSRRVIQTIPAEIITRLKRHETEEQVLIDLAALPLRDPTEIRAFVFKLRRTYHQRS
ncbi:MAG: hypothetical protein LRY69_03270 [Gammaproteobacteria bacterium]|nr:hypothetical protein [Gammaproteobacteria bacterium]